jgi:hypothetical protein
MRWFVHLRMPATGAKLPPSFRFPPLREGNQTDSVPPACRGNLKEGVGNRRPSRIAQLLALMLLFTIVGFAAAEEPLVVEAEGVAEWKPPYEQATREAVRDALRQAIEQACGVRLARLEVGRDGALEQSAQLAFAQGIALRWQMLGEPRRQNGCVYVRVRAEVVPLESLQTPADWREGVANGGASAAAVDPPLHRRTRARRARPPIAARRAAPTA